MKISQDNPYYSKYSDKFIQRNKNFQNALARINQFYGSIDNFTNSYKEYGLHRVKGGIFYREWAPNAHNIYLAGDFNNWNLTDPSTKCDKDPYGVFTLFLSDVTNESGQKVSRIKHGSRVRCFLVVDNQLLSRIPAWINYSVQNHNSNTYDGIFWDPPSEECYEFKHPWPEPRVDHAFLIYEAHIGMAGPEPRVHTYNEFTANVLPLVKEKGYNVVQLMGVMEHSYYASQGYQVTSFFAPSSRFGTPEDLKRLIDTAHEMGIYVFLDTIHSHASKNIGEGLNHFDGTDSQYFHSGKRGSHPVWDSRLFDYSNIEVQRFLLSNLRYYIEVFHFDGFRFDGVGSMIYKNQGVDTQFNNDVYFSDIVDEDAVTYLYLANYVVHKYDMFGITTAEDVSGMVGIARTIEDGGFGFNFRLGMGGADLWVKTLELPSFNDWNLHDIAYNLNNRPIHEKTIAYTECHDQPFPIAYRLLGWGKNDDLMSFLAPLSDEVEHAIALLKMIRLLTFGIAGEAYLNFMGNEFGHPGKIEFPHEGNHNSYDNCCRDFQLADDEMTRYASLARFDKDMLNIEKTFKFLNCCDLGYISMADKESRVIGFERGGLFWVFNFNDSKDFQSYVFGIGNGGEYRVVFSSDEIAYEGRGRIMVGNGSEISTKPEEWNSRKNRIDLCLPSMSAYVLKLVRPDSS